MSATPGGPGPAPRPNGQGVPMHKPQRAEDGMFVIAFETPDGTLMTTTATPATVAGVADALARRNSNVIVL